MSLQGARSFFLPVQFHYIALDSPEPQTLLPCHKSLAIIILLKFERSLRPQTLDIINGHQQNALSHNQCLVVYPIHMK